MTTHAPEELPAWQTVAQRRHVILEWSHDGSWTFARSACNWLLTPSAYDRKPDAPVCIPCSWAAEKLPVGCPDPDAGHLTGDHRGRQ